MTYIDFCLEVYGVTHTMALYWLQDQPGYPGDDAGLEAVLRSLDGALEVMSRESGERGEIITRGRCRMYDHLLREQVRTQYALMLIARKFDIDI